MPQQSFQPVGVSGPQIFGLPVDRDVLFSNHKGVYKKRVEQRQRKLLVKLGFLKPFLEQGEELLLVTPCYSPLGSLGQYLTAFVFVYLKRSLLVFTNRRVFHILTTPAYRYKNMLARIDYDGCRDIELRGGSLFFKYARYNKVERFRNVAVSERRKLRALLQNHVRFGGMKTDLGQRNHVCPRCTRLLTEGKNKCGHCQLKFKPKLLGALLAVLFPGGGYFYTRHYLIGCLSAAVEIFLLATFGLALEDVLQNSSGSIPYAAALGTMVLLVKTVAVIHVTELLAELIPKARVVTPSPLPHIS